ncbi:hypothetical protein BDV18DRAFT_145206 [Aspergillus unguis]
MSNPRTLPITTHHCRFCANLLIATTRDLSTLPTRGKNGTDRARILPLRNYTIQDTSESHSESRDGENGGGGGLQKHYTILLGSSTRTPKPTMIRREDGFEKRFFLRCGRCRVTVGYFLDEVHFPVEGGLKQNQLAEEEGDGQGKEDRAVYLLPGALMETEIMSDEEKMRAVDREWANWFK